MDLKLSNHHQVKNATFLITSLYNKITERWENYFFVGLVAYSLE